MSDEGDVTSIGGRDYWFKIVDFLQQNWAVTFETEAGATIWFASATSGVFDSIESSAHYAEVALTKNGFRRFADDGSASTTMAPLAPPFHGPPHPASPDLFELPVLEVMAT